MPTYFCFVQVRSGGVPELRILDCEDDAQVPAGLAARLAEWPLAHQVEVTEGERRILIAKGAELNGLRRR